VFARVLPVLGAFAGQHARCVRRALALEQFGGTPVEELACRLGQALERGFSGEAVTEDDTVALEPDHAGGAERVQPIEQA